MYMLKYYTAQHTGKNFQVRGGTSEVFGVWRE